MNHDSNFTSQLTPLLWAPVDVRSAMQKSGFQLVPCNYYSNVPSIDDIEQSFEYTSKVSNQAPYLATLNADDSLLASWLGRMDSFAHEFDRPQDDDEGAPAGYFWNNSQFGHSDAMAYYCILRTIKPNKILEIGCGFSTLIAHEAILKNTDFTKTSNHITCIEPYPRPFIETMASNGKIDLQKRTAQSLSADWINSYLSDGDVLFIDSTHTVKSGSDCMHLYLRVLPFITKRLYIHVHDIFLPFGMPKAWALDSQIFWTEQHLLLALITGRHNVSFIFGSTYHEHFTRSKLDNFMRGRAASGGGSFWMFWNGCLIEKRSLDPLSMPP
jgi:Methyltransferase domain